MLKPSHRNFLLNTALGLHAPDKELSMPISDLGVTKDAVVMPDSPDALSLGEMCLDENWDFHWVKGVPWFVTCEGKEIYLDVENKCPIARSTYTVDTDGQHLDFAMPASKSDKKNESNHPDT